MTRDDIPYLHSSPIVRTPKGLARVEGQKMDDHFWRVVMLDGRDQPHETFHLEALRHVD